MQSPHEVHDLKGLLAELDKVRAREGATREILDVLMRSRDHEFPVFDAILSNATRLCNAPIAGLFMADYGKGKYELVASLGAKPQFEKTFKDDPPDLDPKQFAAARAMEEKRFVHVEDLASPTLYGADADHRIVCTQTEGIRTALFVPLIWNDQSIGAIAVWRREVRPFQDDEIALVETFAAQAVIAIENVRQFREVRERLEREKATSDVLSVISKSRDDAQPVFKIIHENITRLCDAPFSGLFLLDETGEGLDLVSLEGSNTDYILAEQTKWPISDPSAQCRAVAKKKVVHIRDLTETAAFRGRHPPTVRAVEQEGIRTFLAVPLIRNDVAIGAIAIYPSGLRPFTDSQVELVKTFAAQAVIAIENVRQFKALETLNAELGDRVEEQVGEIERMGKLKRFLPTAVADTIVSSGSENMLKSHRALLGVLFCDIRGFTAFCETAEPEETIEVLQTYHEEMGKLINAHGAGVDHRMGDGIMVLFNDPLPCEDPAGDAVRLAIAMRARMTELSKDWKRMGFRLGFGVGVALGYATVGMVGYEGRSDYTASGTAINVASRLCELAEDGEILLSTRAAIAVENDFPSVSCGEVTLKGIREPVEVIRLSDGLTS